MKVGDLVRPRWIHNVIGLVSKVRFQNETRDNVCFVRWCTTPQSHGDRWFDESDLELVYEDLR